MKHYSIQHNSKSKYIVAIFENLTMNVELYNFQGDKFLNENPNVEATSLMLDGSYVNEKKPFWSSRQKKMKSQYCFIRFGD